MEALPAGPQWKTTVISLSGYTTKAPMRLYWRDGLEVAEHLFSNPIFAPSMEFTPYREYKSMEQGNIRMYGEFMSADLAWQIQVMGAFIIFLISCTLTVASGSSTPRSRVYWDHWRIRQDAADDWNRK